LKAKVSAGVGSGMGDFLHSLAQGDQYHTVSGGWLTRGAVVDPTSKGLSGE
jgi:hypothetical protein